MQDRFTSRDVRALTGISHRPLPWPDERAPLTRERERHRRFCTTPHLSEVGAILRSRRQGFSLPGVGNGMRFLIRELPQGPAEIVDRSSTYHRLTDGPHLYVESAKASMDTRQSSNQLILAICLTDAVRQVGAGIASGKANTSVTSPACPKRARKAS
jgi:hypothetical protein